MKDIQNDHPKPNCAPNAPFSPSDPDAQFDPISPEPLEPTLQNDLLYIQALNGGWNLPQHHRQHALNRMLQILNDPAAKSWLRTRASNALDRALDADPFADRRAERRQRLLIHQQRLDLERQKIALRKELAESSLNAKLQYQSARLQLDQAKLELQANAKRLLPNRTQANRPDPHPQPLRTQKTSTAAAAYLQNPPDDDFGPNDLANALQHALNLAHEDLDNLVHSPADFPANSTRHELHQPNPVSPIPDSAEPGAHHPTPPSPIKTPLHTEPQPQPRPATPDQALRAEVAAKRQFAAQAQLLNLEAFDFTADWFHARDAHALRDGWLQLPFGQIPPHYPNSKSP